MNPNSVTVDATRLQDTIARILRRNGASPEASIVQATHLVEAELRGHPSHGLRRLRILVERLRAGLITGDAWPRFRWVYDATLRVDGNRGFGPVVAWRVVDEIAERSTRTGIALAVVHNANHVGMLAPYVEALAERGKIAFAFTVSEALVHAWGGSTAQVGTNPIAIGVPTNFEPLVLDMSTGAVSMGRIIDLAERGERLPEGWAVDATGTPTTNAADATQGAISPYGGAKGYALGVAIEAMVGLLAGSAFGQDVHGTLDSQFEADKGDVFICIDVSQLGVERTMPALAAYLDEVRASGDVRIPGDRAHADRARRQAEGIDIDSSLWAATEELEKE